MKLGAFSISLSVKDLNASKDFYEKLGFAVFAGSMEQKYLIMKNENALIGLFHGMFEGNILTFNPGWDENAKNIVRRRPRDPATAAGKRNRAHGRCG
jgi:catechol 2,3-dioxygenase-like lactoylglutathione lyase family enzyme